MAPWGYPGRAIVDLVSGWRYRWFTIGHNGELGDLPADRQQFNGNYVAIPVERVSDVARRMAGSGAPRADSPAGCALPHSG